MNLTELQALLKELTEKYPLNAGQAHGVMLRSDGEPGLMISLVLRSTSLRNLEFRQFNLEEEDLDKDYETLRKELFDIVEATVAA